MCKCQVCHQCSSLLQNALIRISILVKGLSDMFGYRALFWLLFTSLGFLYICSQLLSNSKGQQGPAKRNSEIADCMSTHDQIFPYRCTSDSRDTNTHGKRRTKHELCGVLPVRISDRAKLNCKHVGIKTSDLNLQVLIFFRGQETDILSSPLQSYKERSTARFHSQ